VGVVEVAQQLDFLEEPLGADHVRDLGPQHLHGDEAVVLEVLSQEDRSHPAAAELGLDRVLAGDSSLQPRR
jgi:hypothetical protein